MFSIIQIVLLLAILLVMVRATSKLANPIEKKTTADDRSFIEPAIAKVVSKLESAPDFTEQVKMLLTPLTHIENLVGQLKEEQIKANQATAKAILDLPPFMKNLVTQTQADQFQKIQAMLQNNSQMIAERICKEVKRSTHVKRLAVFIDFENYFFGLQKISEAIDTQALVEFLKNPDENQSWIFERGILFTNRSRWNGNYYDRDKDIKAEVAESHLQKWNDLGFCTHIVDGNVDSQISLTAITLLENRRVDGIVVLGGDSGYTALAQKIFDKGAQIIGVQIGNNSYEMRKRFKELGFSFYSIPEDCTFVKALPDKANHGNYYKPKTAQNIRKLEAHS
jgi:uncharacterized LabA/DUF88 family protein